MHHNHHHQDALQLPRYNFNASIYSQQDFDHQTNQSSPSLLASFISNQSNVYAAASSSAAANAFHNQYTIFNPAEIASVNSSSYNLNPTTSHYYQPSAAAAVAAAAFNHHNQNYNFINTNNSSNSSPPCHTGTNEYPYQHPSSTYYQSHQFVPIAANAITNYSNCGTNSSSNSAANFLPTTMKQIMTSSPLSNNSVDSSSATNVLSQFWKNTTIVFDFVLFKNYYYWSESNVRRKKKVPYFNIFKI